MADDDERQRFRPPTPDPPRYGVAGLPAPPPSSSSYVPPTVSQPAPASDAAAPGHASRNYSPTNPGQPRQAVMATPPEPSNGYAVASLSLSVLGAGMLVVSFGLFFFLSLPCSIAGWVLGAKARSRPGEQGMAQGGLITGIVGTALGVVALLVWVGLWVLADGWADSVTVD